MTRDLQDVPTPDLLAELERRTQPQQPLATVSPLYQPTTTGDAARRFV